jgi:hypothetical protein
MKSRSKGQAITYWVTTAIVVFVLIGGGIGDLIRPAQLVEGMRHLGYPDYVMTLLGIWKVCGGGVIVAPRLPRLKEWAYAGAFIDFSSAVASHIASGDGASVYWRPLLFAVLTLVSWKLRPDSRRL